MKALAVLILCVFAATAATIPLALVSSKTSNDIIVCNVNHYDKTALAGASHNIMEYTSEGNSNRSETAIYVFNNTFVDHSGGNVWMGMTWDKNRNAGLGEWFPTVTNKVIANNIFFNIANSATPAILLGDYTNPNWSPSNGLNLRFHNNLLFAGSQGGTNVVLGTNDSSTGDGIPFINHTNQVIGDPLFASYTLNSASSNFRPVWIARFALGIESDPGAERFCRDHGLRHGRKPDAH